MCLILTHKNGDFDSLASVVAASKLFPGSTALMPEPLQPNVRSFVNLFRDLLPLASPREIEDSYKKVVVVDTNRRDRIGNWTKLLDRADEIIVYDHHHTDGDIVADRLIKEIVGSTTTILFDEIRNNNISLTEFETTLLALGIYEDTGCLTYDITTQKDAAAVASLWELGLNAKILQEYLRSPLSSAQKELFEKLIRNSEFYEINQRRVLISTTVLDEYVVGAAVLMQMLDEIEDAGLTIAIIQMTESIYLAARSRDEDLNLNELLAPFNVRGYPSAVSTHFKGVNAEEVKKQVVEFLKYYLPPAVTAEKAASKPVFTVKSDLSLAEADALLAEHSFKGCPVVENGRLVGIISRRDLRKGLKSDLAHAPVKGFMSTEIITATPDQPLTEIRKQMAENNIGRIPLVDENGKLEGIITRSDILRYLSYFDRRGRYLKREAVTSLSAVEGKDQVNALNKFEENNLLPMMKRRLPHHLRDLFQKISRHAEQGNEKVYLVGGIIRDLLLDYPIQKDIDLVVIGDAVSFAFSLRKNLGGTVRHHDQFGTASLYMKDGLRLDFVTARKEFYTSPAALPRVERSTLKNDLFRRDFTINTMACSLEKKSYGKLYDFFNGREDIKQRKIRALYQLSFVDDPLRILRAIRFEQRYTFIIESKTLKLIEKAVDNKMLSRLSRQRLNQELRLIYKEPSPLSILLRFDWLGLMPYLYPSVKTDQSTWQLLSEMEDVIKWAESRNWDKEPDKELVYLAGLFIGLDSYELSAIIKKLNLSRERAGIVETTCKEAPELLDKLSKNDLNPSEVVSCLDPLPLEAIMAVHALADRKKLRDYLKLYMDGLRYIRPRTRGEDLKKLGIKPGPQYRKIIDNLKQAVLDGEVRTPHEEIDYVLEYLEKDKSNGKEED